jgi:probable F420-dependent oxidoreductase
VRIGATIPIAGPGAFDPGPAAAARKLEEAGYDSVWLADRLLAAIPLRSRYPFNPDGRPRWALDTPFLESTITMAMMVAGTSWVEVGVAAMVVPLRHPVVLARQIATLDALSGGRIVMGVGAGWMEEEFEAIGVPYESRGRRLDESIELMRQCWLGAPEPTDSGMFPMPDGILTIPRPVRTPPVLVAGNTTGAIRRAATYGDGWLPLQIVSHFDIDWFERKSTQFREELERERPGFEPRLLLRVGGDFEQLVQAMPDLAPRLVEAGATDVVIDVEWSTDDGGRRALEMARASGF